ncbi:MAG: hypothetical protein Q9191_005408 [Dirinaria sp. TL-2023a]
MSNPSKTHQLDSIVTGHFPDLKPFSDIYRDIHQNPELGTYEVRTASIAAKHLKDLGFKVAERIGGYGTVGVLSNGTGSTVLLRADMDALPILEKTKLPYASTKVFKTREGKETPVMHACGHDMNPNEENGAGAMAMVKDGLYNHIPRPDYCLAQHCDYRRSGNIAIRSGPCESAADSFLVTIYGHAGHASKPESCIDPIVMASYVIVRLQGIVSRVVPPQETVVVTCGSIHGGDAHNNIPPSVEFKLNIRTYNDEVRAKVLASMRRIIEAECEAAGAPRKPDIKRTHEYPLTDNDAKMSAELRSLFEESFGEDHVETMEQLAGSEDFPNLALPHNTPYVIWFQGATAVERYDEAVRAGQVDLLPQIHSDGFAPSINTTMKTGVRAFSLAALYYLA